MTRLPIAYNNTTPQLGSALMGPRKKIPAGTVSPNELRFRDMTPERQQRFQDTLDARGWGRPIYRAGSPAGVAPVPTAQVGAPANIRPVGAPMSLADANRSVQDVRDFIQQRTTPPITASTPASEIIRQTRASLGGAPPTATPTSTPIAPPFNPYQASRDLQSSLVQGGRDILAQRADSNEMIRQQMAARRGSRFAEPSLRGQFLPSSPQPAGPTVPDGFVDEGQRTAPVVVGGLGHRILRRTPERAAADQALLAQQAYRDQMREGTPQQVAGPENEKWLKAHLDRKAEMEDRRGRIEQGAVAKSQARDWRMSGGPQQMLYNNMMLARNPGLAIAAMNNMQGERRFQLEYQQGQAQIEELKRQGKFQEAEAASRRNQERWQATLQARQVLGPNATQKDIEDYVNRSYGPPGGGVPVAGGAVPGAGGAPDTGIPVEWRGMDDDQLVAAARDAKISEDQIQQWIQGRHPKLKGVTPDRPTGPRLIDAFPGVANRGFPFNPAPWRDIGRYAYNLFQ